MKILVENISLIIFNMSLLVVIHNTYEPLKYRSGFHIVSHMITRNLQLSTN